MRKSIFILAAFTSIAMLLAVVAVVRYSVSITIAFFVVAAALIMLAVPLIFRGRQEFFGYNSTSKKSRATLKWFSVPFVIGVLGALAMAFREGWNIGDTIGAVFAVFVALLLVFEFLRNRRATP